MKYFEEKVQAGEWEEVEKYLSGYTKVDDNRYSMKIFFEIRKQKYLEALDRYLILFFLIPTHTYKIAFPVLGTVTLLFLKGIIYNLSCFIMLKA